MSFGANLKRIRKEKGFTLKQLGDLLGCSAQLISQYEANNRTPKIETKIKIAQALNVPLNDLVPENVWSITNAVVDLFTASDNKNFEEIPEGVNEQYLISLYRGLNETGQSKVIEYAEDLSKTKEYTEYDKK